MNSSTSTSSASRVAWWLLPLSLALALPVYNFLQDYYGVFERRADWRGLVPNERYLKYEVLQARLGELSALMFGSSKAANIPFQRHLGDNAYNVAYSEGLPADHLQVIARLVGKMPALSKVYIAVDEMSYLLDPASHAQDYLRRQHPDVAGIPRWRFLLSYLMRPLSNADEQYFFAGRERRPEVIYEIDTSGRSLCPACDREIDTDPAAHRQETLFRFPYNPPDRYGIDRLAADIRAIQRLLEANQVELVLFLQPGYANNLRWHNLAILEQLKRELADIAPFHDFLVYDPRLADPMNFYDVVHFRPNIGQDIMDILGGIVVPGAGEFGFRVEPDTIEMHLEQVRESLLGNLVSQQKYLQDLDYSVWLKAHGFSKQALPVAAGRPLLDIAGQPLECHIDSINRRPFNGEPIKISVDDAGMLELNGWGAADGRDLEAFLRVQSRDMFATGRVYPIAAGLRRQDVARRRGAQYLHSGFRGNLDIGSPGRGNYRLSLLLGAGQRWLECSDRIELVIY